jgi:DNA-directed RNA polymerase specialized sigma24 family protein
MDSAKALKGAQDLTQFLSRALVTAHLLTGNLEHAEQAVLKAIDRWNPDEEREEQLFFYVIDAAGQAHTPPEPREPVGNDLYLPDELKAVLRLEPALRRCFVLRNLVGLPSRVCAQLLRLLPSEVDEYSVSAVQRLVDS